MANPEGRDFTEALRLREKEGCEQAAGGDQATQVARIVFSVWEGLLFQLSPAFLKYLQSYGKQTERKINFPSIEHSEGWRMQNSETKKIPLGEEKKNKITEDISGKGLSRDKQLQTWSK